MSTIPPPNPTVQQIFDTSKRRRKPLIDLTGTERERAHAKAIAERDAAIDNLTRQLRHLQEAATASAGYVKSLEEQLRAYNAQRQAPAPRPAPPEPPEPPRPKRQRVEPEQQAAPTAPPSKTEEITTTTTPETTKP